MPCFARVKHAYKICKVTRNYKKKKQIFQNFRARLDIRDKKFTSQYSLRPAIEKLNKSIDQTVKSSAVRILSKEQLANHMLKWLTDTKATDSRTKPSKMPRPKIKICNYCVNHKLVYYFPRSLTVYFYVASIACAINVKHI